MQGFNMGRYVPPEHEGVLSGNQLHSKKTPGFHGNQQTIRFEMPFHILCTTCEGHIAQGVRFNAEKKRVGNYYSTPIFSFRMKHASCGGWIEIRTDPKNTDYVVAEGGKKKAGQEAKDVGIIRIRDLEEGVKAEDPFAKLEKAAEDTMQKSIHAPRIEELQQLSDRQWSDPYEHSRKMRRIFREERKRLQSKAAAAEEIQNRLGLNIPLLDSDPEDEVQAKLVDFGHSDDIHRMDQVHAAPLFILSSSGAGGLHGGSDSNNSRSSSASPAKNSQLKKGSGSRSNTENNSNKAKGKTKAEISSQETKVKLGENLRRNTRQRIDPFLAMNSRDEQQQQLGPTLTLKGIKRKNNGGGDVKSSNVRSRVVKSTITSTTISDIKSEKTAEKEGDEALAQQREDGPNPPEVCSLPALLALDNSTILSATPSFQSSLFRDINTQKKLQAIPIIIKGNNLVDYASDSD